MFKSDTEYDDMTRVIVVHFKLFPLPLYNHWRGGVIGKAGCYDGGKLKIESCSTQVEKTTFVSGDKL